MEENIDDKKVEKVDYIDLISRAIALIIGIVLFVSDKYMKLFDESLGMEVYGGIAMIALGYAPNIGNLFTKK